MFYYICTLNEVLVITHLSSYAEKLWILILSMRYFTRVIMGCNTRNYFMVVDQSECFI